MIKLPFNRKPNNVDRDKPSVAFENYCHLELERRRDSGGSFDEARFKAAMELAAGRLRRMEVEGGA